MKFRESINYNRAVMKRLYRVCTYVAFRTRRVPRQVIPNEILDGWRMCPPIKVIITFADELYMHRKQLSLPCTLHIAHIYIYAETFPGYMCTHISRQYDRTVFATLPSAKIHENFGIHQIIIYKYAFPSKLICISKLPSWEVNWYVVNLKCRPSFTKWSLRLTS